MPQLRNRVGVVGPSSVVPPVELEIGVETLSTLGFDVKVHRHTLKKHLFFAGKHADRAEAFFDYAVDPEVDIVWCARGGFGANHLIPYLDKLTRNRGRPNQKLLVGFSDVTLLHEYVRKNWHWQTLHAPMVAWNRMSLMPSADRRALNAWARGAKSKEPWTRNLKFYGKKPQSSIEGVLTGGNMMILASLLGTPLSPSFRGKILFLEDLAESIGRVDRIVQHLHLSGCFDGLKAIVLGDFDSTDSAPLKLKSRPSKKNLKRALLKPKKNELKPIRPVVSYRKGFEEIFGNLSEKLGIPVAYGLPVGHGNRNAPLPLGANYTLSVSGDFSLKSWDWIL